MLTKNHTPKLVILKILVKFDQLSPSMKNLVLHRRGWPNKRPGMEKMARICNRMAWNCVVFSHNVYPVQFDGLYNNQLTF